MRSGPPADKVSSTKFETDPKHCRSTVVLKSLCLHTARIS